MGNWDERPSGVYRVELMPREEEINPLIHMFICIPPTGM
jgi:hypothetical protein